MFKNVATNTEDDYEAFKKQLVMEYFEWWIYYGIGLAAGILILSYFK